MMNSKYAVKLFNLQTKVGELVKLKNISNIHSGLILSRKRARNELELIEQYKVLSLNNIDDQGYFNETEFDQFSSNDLLDEHYFTNSGDILLRLNSPFTAVYIDKYKSGILIPSSFVSIEVTDDDFLPEYISWFLNSDLVKQKFHKSQSGTRTPNINQKIIRELSIPKLSRTEQENITNLHQLYLKERRLLRQLMDEKEQLYREITKQITREKLGEI